MQQNKEFDVSNPEDAREFLRLMALNSPANGTVEQSAQQANAINLAAETLKNALQKDE